MKKKVCFVVDSIFGLGGIQRAVTIIANELLNDYEVFLISRNKLRKNKITKYNLKKDIKIFYSRNTISNILYFPIRCLNYLNRKWKFIDKNTRIYEFLTYKCRFIEKKRVLNFLNKEKINYVIAEGISEIVFLSYMRNKIDAYFIGCWHSSFFNYSQDYSDRILFQSLTIPDKCIVLSSNDVNILKHKFDFVVEKLPNPIEINKKYVSNLMNKKFVAVGRLDIIKRFDLMIEAFEIFNKKNTDWTLDIIGEGKEKEKLEKMIKEKQLTKYIKILGKSNNVFEKYKDASILLMTSTSEGMPMVILEAMMSGLPIIAFEMPILKEMIDQSNPLVVQKDVQAYANEMLKLANDYQLRKEISNRNIYDVRKFDKNIIIKEWKKILK